MPVPSSNSNLTDNITYIISELLCSFIINPPNNATIISKSDSGGSNNYWGTEYLIFIIDINDIYNGPIVQ